MDVDPKSGEVVLGLSDFEAEMKLFKSAFGMDLLGWYSTGALAVLDAMLLREGDCE